MLLGSAFFGIYTLAHRHSDKESSSQTNSSSAEPSDNLAPQEPSFDKTAYSNSDATSIWVVVNKLRPLEPLKYAPADLVSVGNGHQMRREAADALKELIATAKASGLTISAQSGYRSYNYQVTVYNREVNNFGQATADTESARPGYSEHQTGFAVDVGGGGCNIDNCFANTAEGKWVAANAYKYGFIVRYTATKQAVTGYRAEPWHIRYIGKSLSEEMQKDGIQTLEEFFGLPAAPNYN